MDALNAVNLDIAKGTDMKSKLLSGMVLFMLSASVMAQQSFSTPDQATDALASAISEHNERAMSNLLGENWRDFLPPEGVDPDAVDRFLRDWNVHHKTVISGNVAHLVVGDNGWQLPIPVVKTASGWQFHVHFSRIEYSAGGEKRHWTFADTQFGPEPQPLMELLAERKLAPVVICESAGTQAEDAQTMQQMYRAARNV